MEKDLSIIVTSYKKSSLLKLCLQSLKNNIREVSYEIIVVDSETEEPTYDLMRENFSDVKFVPNKKNVGFLSLVNQGLDVAEGKFFFIINSDIIVKNNGLLELLNFVKSDKKIGMAGPKLINFDNTVQPSCFRFYSPLIILYRRTFLKNFQFAKKKLSRFLMKKERKLNRPIEADWLMGSAMLVRKEAVDEVGQMDKRFFLYFEDVDWCWRFWKHGYKVIFYPLVEMYHYHGKKSASANALQAVFFNKYTRVHIKSALKFFLKHFGEKKPH